MAGPAIPENVARVCSPQDLLQAVIRHRLFAAKLSTDFFGGAIEKYQGGAPPRDVCWFINPW